MLQRLEGGFVTRLRPNDWVYRLDGQDQVNMMGCCPPSGMHALYLAWRNTLSERDGRVYVNMSLSHDRAAATVTSHAPQRGLLVVKARRSADYYLRPPAWVAPETLRLRRNGRAIVPRWQGAYVRVVRVKAGETVRMEHPLPAFTQRVAIGSPASKESFELHWVGNNVAGVSPGGARLPIFVGRAKALSLNTGAGE